MLVLGEPVKLDRKAVRVRTPRDEPWDIFRERYSTQRLVQRRDRTAAHFESRLDIAERIIRPKTIGDMATRKALELLQRELLAGGGVPGKRKRRSPHTAKSHMASILAALRWALDDVPKIDGIKTSKLKVMKGRPIFDTKFQGMLDATAGVVGIVAAASWRFVGIRVAARRVDAHVLG